MKLFKCTTDDTAKKRFIDAEKQIPHSQTLNLLTRTLNHSLAPLPLFFPPFLLVQEESRLAKNDRVVLLIPFSTFFHVRHPEIKVPRSALNGDNLHRFAHPEVREEGKKNGVGGGERNKSRSQDKRKLGGVVISNKSSSRESLLNTGSIVTAWPSLRE
ncbi:hypothetical protein CEXT_755291 [Caerostris extrusa]|uniref:Uncharacterized protein n=1 Tax=Caerostris extrusa TaxID=172846 RepID=A0AAV4P3E8_CAEEX|nr:hypothetical protein CEXT_755291 [Caerostris extrusa]